MRLWATSEHVSRPRDRWMAFPWVRIIYEAFHPVNFRSFSGGQHLPAEPLRSRFMQRRQER